MERILRLVGHFGQETSGALLMVVVQQYCIYYFEVLYF